VVLGSVESVASTASVCCASIVSIRCWASGRIATYLSLELDRLGGSKRFSSLIVSDDAKESSGLFRHFDCGLKASLLGLGNNFPQDVLVAKGSGCLA
jgi:hypothetical protein